MKKALIVQGGWDGHQPKEVAELMADILKQEHFEVGISDTLDSLKDEEQLKRLALIVPVWTAGTIAPEQLSSLLNAIKSGVGIAGCHGGMGDSFRNDTEYQYMVGANLSLIPETMGLLIRCTSKNETIL